MIVRTLAVLLVLLFSNFQYCNCAQAQQSGSLNANATKRLGELEKSTRSLQEHADSIRADHKKLGEAVTDLQKRIGDDGWKALDATTKLSSLQWQTYGFVLTIILALSFGGWQGYKLIKDKLEAEIIALVRAHEGVLRHNTGAAAFGQLSMGTWNQYSAIPETPANSAERKRLLDTAILLSSFALEHAEALTNMEKTKFVDLVTNIRANHAYWLAEDDRTNGKPGNAEQAMKLAKLAFAVASTYLKGNGTEYINRWPDWIESYCFVLSRFGSDAEKLATKEVIRAVCDDVRVDGAWKTLIRIEYGITTT